MPVGKDVRNMFSRIAIRYDRANHFLSGGMDYYWRRILGKQVLQKAPKRIVDLATGSGDVVFSLNRRATHRPEIIGIDFCEPMLVEARQKKEKQAPDTSIRFQQGDILDLSLADNSTDAVTIAFGYRNLENRSRGLNEIKRVLKPGGYFYCLEFSQPYAPIRPLYYLYLKTILPTIARILTRDKSAYDYLAGSIESFPGRQEISQELKNAGFSSIKAMPLTGSIVAIHQGQKPLS